MRMMAKRLKEGRRLQAAWHGHALHWRLSCFRSRSDGCVQGAHQLRLLNQRGRVLAHVVDDQHGGGAPEGGLALAGDQQRIHERLGVMPPDADEQAVNEPPDHCLARVDARNDLHMSRALMAYLQSLNNIAFLTTRAHNHAWAGRGRASLWLTWGMTTSQVSMETWPKPSSRARSTSGAEPWVNHSVSRRRMSCRLDPFAASPAGPAPRSACACAAAGAESEAVRLPSCRSHNHRARPL